MKNTNPFNDPFRPPPQAPELPSAEWFAQAFHDLCCNLEDVGKDFRTAREREPFKTLFNNFWRRTK